MTWHSRKRVTITRQHREENALMLPASSPVTPMPSPLQLPPGKVPDVTITGTCFGAAGAFNGDSDHFRITDLGSRGTISDLENARKIAVFNANCTQADTLGIGAFQSRGAAYDSDGFACTATTAGAGPEWSSTWSGTYYVYDCKAGAAQVAFNWGADYAR